MRAIPWILAAGSLAGCAVEDAADPTVPPPSPGAGEGEGEGAEEEEGNTRSDDGAYGQGDDGQNPVDLPHPAPPELNSWPCPDGWAALAPMLPDGVSVTACTPPAQVEEPCGQGLVQGVADAGCRPIGRACPQGAPDDAWILAQARLPADSEAEIRRLTPGEDVAGGVAGDDLVAYLAPGRYPVGVIQPGRGSHVVGACAGDVTLEARVNLYGGGGLAGLTLQGDLQSKGGTLSGVVIRGSEQVGLFAGEGTTELDDVAIRDTGAAGLAALNTAVIVARGLTVERTVGVGVIAAVYEPDPGGASLTLDDLAVRGTVPRRDGLGGIGLTLDSGASGRVRRAVIDGGATSGIEVASTTGTALVTAAFEDVVVRGVERKVGTEFGSGLLVGPGTDVTVTRLLVDGGQLTGILAASPFEDRPVGVEVQDLVARDIRAGRAVTAYGVAFGGHGRMTLRRAVITTVQGVGLLAGLSNYPAHSTLTAEDVLIHAIDSGPARVYGRGVEIKRGARADLRRMRVDGAHEGGVVALGWGGAPETRVRLSDVRVERVVRAPCADIPPDEPFTCRLPDGVHEGGGHGVLAVTGARLDLERFHVADNEFVGLGLAREAELDARQGVITGNGVGLNIGVPDYDSDRLEASVFVFDNDLDFGRQELPVPDASVLAR